MLALSTVSITGNDTLIINGRVIANLADGDNGALTFPNELMSVKTGKNANTLYAFNNMGVQAELTLRLVRGSPDDRFLTALNNSMQLSPATFVLMTGTFVKRTGNGLGFVTNDTYVLQGGVFFKNVEVTSNAEGNTDQSAAIHSIRWGQASRSII
jgi:hypothetical protein